MTSNNPTSSLWTHQRGKEITLEETFRFRRAAIFYAFENANVFTEQEREALADAIEGAFVANIAEEQAAMKALQAHLADRRSRKKRQSSTSKRRSSSSSSSS